MPDCPLGDSALAKPSENYLRPGDTRARHRIRARSPNWRKVRRGAYRRAISDSLLGLFVIVSTKRSGPKWAWRSEAQRARQTAEGHPTRVGRYRLKAPRLQPPSAFTRLTVP